MGQLADHYGHERLPVKETEVVLKKVIADANSGRGSQDADGRRKQDVDPAVKAATSVLPTLARCGELPEYDTARALRLAAAADRNSAVAKQVQAILQPADNYGGRISFAGSPHLCYLSDYLWHVVHARSDCIVADRRFKVPLPTVQPSPRPPPPRRPARCERSRSTGRWPGASRCIGGSGEIDGLSVQRQLTWRAASLIWEFATVPRCCTRWTRPGITPACGVIKGGRLCRRRRQGQDPRPAQVLRKQAALPTARGLSMPVFTRA